MRSAARNCYVQIQEATVTRDAVFNEQSEGWAERTKCWATLTAVKGVERIAGPRVEVIQRWLLSADHHELQGVTEQMRVVFSPSHGYGTSPPATDLVYFDIESVQEDFLNRTDTVLSLRRAAADDRGL